MAITRKPTDGGGGGGKVQRVVGPKLKNIYQREHIAANDAGNLSDIDDSEVVGYLNNTKEIHYKKIIWEKMNQEFVKSDHKLKVTKRKREIGGQKGIHAKRLAKTNERVEDKRTSSKINYDALQKLTDELRQLSGGADLGELEPKPCGNGVSVSEDSNICIHELGQENEYGEDDDSFRDDYDDSFRDDYDDSYHGYETGYYDGDDFDN